MTKPETEKRRMSEETDPVKVLQWMRDMIAVSYSITTYRNMVPALDYALSALRAHTGGVTPDAAPDAVEYDRELIARTLDEVAGWRGHGAVAESLRHQAKMLRIAHARSAGGEGRDE